MLVPSAHDTILRKNRINSINHFVQYRTYIASKHSDPCYTENNISRFNSDNNKNKQMHLTILSLLKPQHPKKNKRNRPKHSMQPARYPHPRGKGLQCNLPHDNQNSLNVKGCTCPLESKQQPPRHRNMHVPRLHTPAFIVWSRFSFLFLSSLSCIVLLVYRPIPSSGIEACERDTNGWV